MHRLSPEKKLQFVKVILFCNSTSNITLKNLHWRLEQIEDACGVKKKIQKWFYCTFFALLVHFVNLISESAEEESEYLGTDSSISLNFENATFTQFLFFHLHKISFSIRNCQLLNSLGIYCNCTTSTYLYMDWIDYLPKVVATKVIVD